VDPDLLRVLLEDGERGGSAEGRLKALLLKVSSSQPTDALTDDTTRPTPCGPQFPFISGNFLLNPVKT
jgi:hypothetical protein